MTGMSTPPVPNPIADLGGLNAQCLNDFGHRGIAERRDPVDVRRRQAGIVDRGAHSLQRQLQRRGYRCGGRSAKYRGR